MTTEQQNLFQLVRALPVHDSKLTIAEINSNTQKAAEEAVGKAAKQLAAAGELREALESTVSEEGEPATTLRHYLQSVKRYQLTEDGMLLSKSKARLRMIDGIPDHQEQRSAFESAADFLMQDMAPNVFLRKLKANPKAKALFETPALRVFDIGYGDGRISSRIAKTLLEEGIPNIAYHGMDLRPANAPAAKQQLESVGIAPDHIELSGGELGHTHSDLYDKTPNRALEIEHWPAADKYDIALALNVNNFGDKEKFLAQAQHLLKDNGIFIAQHDESGDLLTFKKECNESGVVQLRNAESKSDIIAAGIAEAKYVSSHLEVPYTITFPKVNEALWNALKNVETGVFNKPYEDDVAGTGVDAPQYKRFRLLVEFTLGEPLGTFSPEERSFLLDKFHALLEAKDYELTGISGMQIVLAREHSKDMAQAVEETAREVGSDLKVHTESANRPGGSWASRS